MKKVSLLFSAALAFVLAGCGSTPQPEISLDQTFYNNKTKVIGLYMDQLPETDTYLVGASCLLCYGVASAANSSLTNHAETLPSDELMMVPSAIKAKLEQQGFAVIIIEQPIKLNKLKKIKKAELNFTKRDYRPLKEQHGIDSLLVIDINAIGFHRSYNAYTPLTDPLASVSGTVFTVDLTSNKYESYNVIDFKVPSEGNWDEPPMFPGLTNSYHQTIELSKEKIVSVVL